MQTQITKVSVVVPIYNVEDYLSECVDSLLDQDILLEIILVNDGSTDSSGTIADSYAAANKQVKVIHQANKGQSTARNIGFKAASGRYVVFIDSDDYIEKDSLKKLFLKAEEIGADMIVGEMTYVLTDGRTRDFFSRALKKHDGRCLSGKEWFVTLFSSDIHYVMPCNYMYRRDWLIRESLSFIESLREREDELWTPFALSRAQKVLVMDIPFYYYRKREGSIMHTLPQKRQLIALLYIADQLALLSDSLTWEQDRTFKSWLWVAICRLCSMAFGILVRIMDSTFVLPEHHLDVLPGIYRKLDDDAKVVAKKFYLPARENLREYQCWLSRLPMVSDSEYKKDENHLLILFYSSIKNIGINIGERLKMDRISEIIPANVTITDDRGLLSVAGVVVFYVPLLPYDLDEDIDKPAGQIWVGWSSECETNHPWVHSEEIKELFDLWMTYRLDSDVVLPYYDYSYSEKLLEPATEKSKDICMLISGQSDQSGRLEYLSELMDHIHIDSYGSWRNNCKQVAGKDHKSQMEIIKEYKFTIAFEEAIGEDYVTGKFFDPLLAGSVPIYLGAPNIDRFAPGENSFVDVRDYPIPEQLAANLRDLCEDDHKYGRMQEWRLKPLNTELLSMINEQRVHPFISLIEKIREVKTEEIRI